MGANIKDLRIRIRSVDSTLHLTKAMGLVASSKIRRASDGMMKGRDYASAVAEVIRSLTQSPECRKSPYMRTGGERTKIIVIAGDRGLCGGYNAEIFRTMRGLAADEIIPIGKRACDRFGGMYSSAENFSCADGSALAKRLCEEFLQGGYDKLRIVCTGYRSLMSQQAECREVLPLTAAEQSSAVSTVFEPDEITVLNAAVTEYVSGLIMAAVRESFACEVAARRVAMDSAGKNAQEMINDLQLEYNRARQGAITQEITEIVAGSGN